MKPELETQVETRGGTTRVPGLPVCPESLGPYRLLAPLGRGGMGVVFKAQHRDTGQLVALKTLGLAHARSLRGLRSEIHALARLRHPGIVRILEDGFQDGIPWYAMELLDGVNLRHWRLPEVKAGGARAIESLAGSELVLTQTAATLVDANCPVRLQGATVGLDSELGDACQPPGTTEFPVPLRAGLGLVRSLCSALSYLHGEGLVHRDLKPENILVGRNGRPILVDFGLAFSSGARLGREILDVVGQVSGTCEYMAPEQAQGELVDARADLYALGCLLFEMAAGRPPFQGRSPYQILLQHIETPAPRIADFRPGVSAELEELIQRLLQKDPRDRIGHADDVAAALGRLGIESNDEVQVPVARPYLYRPTFSGRQAILECIQVHLDNLRFGRGGAVLIGGESGIGKTRLLLELAKSCTRDGFQVLQGHCNPMSGGLQAFRRPLQSIGDRCRERGEEEARRLLGDRGMILAAFEPTLQGLPGIRETKPSELPSAAARMRLFTHLIETLEALVRAPVHPESPDAEPWLLILDDLQWSDELSLGALHLLIQSGKLEQLPLLVIGSYRSEEIGGDLEAFLRLPGLDNLGLGRLGQPAVGQLARDMLGLGATPEEFARFLEKHSEGNPFFIAEYLRSAVEQGLLFRDVTGQWQVGAVSDGAATAETYAMLPLPPTLLELVSARLERLGVEARALIDGLSVLGREADVEVLAAQLELDATEIHRGILEAVTRQLVEEEGCSLRFLHDKLREVAYSRLQSDRKRQLHYRAAEVLGSQAKKPEPGILANHWERAGFSDRAKPCHLAAAQDAVGRFAWNEAEAHFTAYLLPAAEPTEERVRALLEFGFGVLWNQGKNERALEILSAALEQSRFLGELELEARALESMGNVKRVLGDLDGAEDALLQAMGLFQRVRHRAGEGKLLRDLSLLHFNRGQMDESIRLCLAALEIQRELRDREEQSACLNNLSTLFRETGQPGPSQEFGERALAMAQQSGSRRLEAGALGTLGIVHRDQNRLDQARALFERAAAIFREVGDRRGEGVCQSNLANVLSHQGFTRLATEAFQQALQSMRWVGDRRGSAIVLGNLASLTSLQGNQQEALTHVQEALAFHRQIGDRRFEGRIQMEMAQILRELGRTEESWTALRQGLELLGTDDGLFRYRATAKQLMGWLHLDEGQVESALEAYGSVLMDPAIAQDPTLEAQIRLSVASLQRLAFGNLAKAREELNEAIRVLGDLVGYSVLQMLWCEEGFQALAQGQSAQVWLERAEGFAANLGYSAESELWRTIRRLRGAQQVFEEHGPANLFHGERLEDLQPGLQRWLQSERGMAIAGQLEASDAQQREQRERTPP